MGGRASYWMGVRPSGSKDVFAFGPVPTAATHGHLYAYVVGPFRTKRGAEFMRDRGENNPHCRRARDADRLAKLLTEGRL